MASSMEPVYCSSLLLLEIGSEFGARERDGG